MRSSISIPQAERGIRAARQQLLAVGRKREITNPLLIRDRDRPCRLSSLQIRRFQAKTQAAQPRNGSLRQRIAEAIALRFGSHEAGETKQHKRQVACRHRCLLRCLKSSLLAVRGLPVSDSRPVAAESLALPLSARPAGVDRPNRGAVLLPAVSRCAPGSRSHAGNASGGSMCSLF